MLAASLVGGGLPFSHSCTRDALRGRRCAGNTLAAGPGGGLAWCGMHAISSGSGDGDVSEPMARTGNTRVGTVNVDNLDGRIGWLQAEGILV